MSSKFVIPENDPIADPARKEIIDQVLEANKDLNGAMMVVLNELQGKIGFISETMQQYIAAQ